ncbi:MAG: TrkA family potassium uptake protein [Fervidicoccaceae archaeon]
MRILIVGGGAVGGYLARLLSERGHEVLVVDKEAEKLRSLQREADVTCITRDATDPGLYDEMNLASFDVVVACTDSDEVNLFVSVLAKEANVPLIVARARSPKVAALLQRLGVRHVVVGPILIAKLMLSMVEGLFGSVPLTEALSGLYSLLSLTIGTTDSSVGKTLGELELPEGSAILAIVKDNEVLAPSDSIELSPGTIVVALVRSEKSEDFERVFR